MSGYDEAKVVEVSKTIRDEFRTFEARVRERLGQALGLKPQTAKASKMAAGIARGLEVEV